MADRKTAVVVGGSQGIWLAAAATDLAVDRGLPR
jgi:NAD(P)-dependent dehydrogenase (short-subunit alcohol dehydrogenase family)